MKLSLKFIVIFVTSLLVSLPVFELYSPPSAQALVSSGYWTKRTPKTGTGFNTDADYTGMGQFNTYYSAHTPFAELIETRSTAQGGGRVIHWFLGIPNMGMWGHFSGQMATILHSSNQGSTWNRITPTGIYGGQMEFIVVPEPWHTNNDPAQSRWSGKLLLYTNKTDSFNVSGYLSHRPALYRYDGDGFTNNWTNLINENIPGFNGNYALGTSYYNRYGPYGKCFQSFLQIFNGQLYLVSWLLTTNAWASQWRIVVQTFDGTFNQLINAPSSVIWTHKWQSDIYSNWAYQAPTYLLFFEKINDYLFLGTGHFANPSPFQIPTNPGIVYQSDTNGENFVHNLPAPTIGRVMSDLSPLGAQNRLNLTFTLQIGGVNYTAYARAHAGFWPGAGDTIFRHFAQDYWGYYMYYNWTWIAPGYGDYLWRGYWMDMWGWSGTGGNVAFEYSSINHTTREVWVSMIMPAASAAPSPIVVPLTMIEFKDYAYAGFSHNSGTISGPFGSGKVRRTNRFTDEDDNPNTFVDINGIPTAGGFGNWDDCGTLVDYDYNIFNRNMTSRNCAVLSFLKTQVPATGGGMEDDLLFIAGSSTSSFAGSGVNTLFVTEGYDQFGNENLPLEFTLHEDEWNYDRDNPTLHYQGINPNWMYNIYNMKNTSIGMLVFLATPRLRLDEGYGQRYFHILNAAPSLRIDHEPKPVVIERGQTADILFELTPLGGFGSAGFRMQLVFDATGIFLPTQDPLGNPYTENQKFSSRLDTPGPLLFFDNIPWYANPTIRATLSQPLGIFDALLVVTDQMLGMQVEYEFRIQVVPPRPGFSVSVIPSTRQLYAGETVCFDVNLESRFDFEDNVIVGIFWQTEPPQNDTSFEWMDSTYIYDRLDDTMVEVITRRNIGTQYQFCLHTEKTVSPGNYEFMLMFFSTVETRTANVRVRILPPRPTFTISTNPRIGKTVPGGIVHYDITIESIDNYVGPVSLFIENLPVTVEMVRLTPSTVNLSLANPVAYAELVLQTFSATYAPHRPTNFFARVISRSVINLSWESSRRGTHEIAGYEIWRGPNQYIERANRIAIVGPNVVSYDDAEGIESGRNYYYFLRSFDNQDPPNYSDFAPSNEARVARSGNLDTIKPQAIVGTGTLPGYYRFLVSGDGIGIDEFGSSYSFSVTANTDLLVYRSVDDMKTPSFDFWGIILLMFGLMGFVLFQHKKKRWETN